MASITKSIKQNTVTKSIEKRRPANLIVEDLLASHVTIDGEKLTVLDHILNDNIHLNQDEKDKIQDIVKNGAGIKPEDWEKILEALEGKADKDHTHNNDADFYILASQVVETEDRKFLNKTEKDSLSGITGNIQGQIDILKALADESMKFKGRYNNYASMIADNPVPRQGDTTFIDNDENQENASTIYYYKDKAWLRIKKDKSATNSGWIASNITPSDKNVLWVDVSTAEPVLKWFNGATWVDLTGLKAVKASNVTQETNLRFVTDKDASILGKLTENTASGLLMYNGIVLGSGGGSTGATIDDTTQALDKTYSSYKIKGELDKKQADLGFTPENAAKKGVANGYAPLNKELKVPRINVYDSNFVVPDEAARLALTKMVDGDICYEESTTKMFVYSALEWKLVSKGDAVVIGKNNFLAERNPTRDDDVREGYLPGSTWINKYTKKAYICIDSTISDAQWDLMAGQVTLNIGEIIPFKADVNEVIIKDGRYLYKIPPMNKIVDFVEVTLNGHELMQDDEFIIDSIIGIDGVEENYIALKQELNLVDHLYGEIYKHDIKKTEEQMLKGTYDSNNNGKVDIAELSDVAKGIPDWSQLTRYEEKQLVLKDGSIYISLLGHTSALTFENDKWKIVIAEANNLDKFSTNDLKESTTRKYLTAEEKINVGLLPGVFNTVNSNSRQIATHSSDISSLKSLTTNHTNRLDNFRFTQLIDTPNSLAIDAYIKVNSDGTGITQIKNPTFPVKSIIDSKGTRYNSLDVLKFTHLEMTGSTPEGVFTFGLKANALDLMDMPNAHEHGKVLVSDWNNKKFVLADKESLTMSIENFSKVIELSDWQLVDGRYETTIIHNMSSESLIVSFVDVNKIEERIATYKILDRNSIKVYSDSNKILSCTINCALGAGNGYWQYLMDWSKIDFVDDTKLRADRAYSSNKLMNILSEYALKNNYYTKTVSDLRYGSIQKEHSHSNKSTLDNIGENADGNITFKNIRLLTEMNPTTLSLEEITNHLELTEIYDMRSLYLSNNMQAILASEILVCNMSSEESAFKITDGGLDLVSVSLKPNEIQKYHLGISNKVKIFVKGNIKTILTVSAF